MVWLGLFVRWSYTLGLWFDMLGCSSLSHITFTNYFSELTNTVMNAGLYLIYTTVRWLYD
jgi:hypothetical protein